MAVWRCVEYPDLYCTNWNSDGFYTQALEWERNLMYGSYTTNGGINWGVKAIARGSNVITSIYVFPNGYTLSMSGGFGSQFRQILYDGNGNRLDSSAGSTLTICNCYFPKVFIDASVPNPINPSNTNFYFGYANTSIQTLGWVNSFLKSLTWQGPFFSPVETIPITYIPINSSLNGPSSATSGDTVNVSVSFPDGYIYQEAGVQVYNQDGTIPFNYSDGQITFTMP